MANQQEAKIQVRPEHPRREVLHVVARDGATLALWHGGAASEEIRIVAPARQKMSLRAARFLLASVFLSDTWNKFLERRFPVRSIF